MLAHMYAKMAATSGGCKSEYADKASENINEAIKADPQTSMLNVPGRSLLVSIFVSNTQSVHYRAP